MTLKTHFELPKQISLDGPQSGFALKVHRYSPYGRGEGNILETHNADWDLEDGRLWLRRGSSATNKTGQATLWLAAGRRPHIEEINATGTDISVHADGIVIGGLIIARGGATPRSRTAGAGFERCEIDYMSAHLTEGSLSFDRTQIKDEGSYAILHGCNYRARVDDRPSNLDVVSRAVCGELCEGAIPLPQTFEE